MYRISSRKRKYSSTPIVRIDVDAEGREHEEIVCICAGQGKKDGDALAERIVNLLNTDMLALLESAFEAGRESEQETIRGNIQEGVIGKDGFYFHDWCKTQQEIINLK